MKKGFIIKALGYDQYWSHYEDEFDGWRDAAIYPTSDDETLLKDMKLAIMEGPCCILEVYYGE